MTLCWPLRSLLLLFFLSSAYAHDGGFGHSRRTIHVAATQSGFTLEYRVVLNRDEALAEMALMDIDHNGVIKKDEKDRYFESRGRKLAELLQVKVGKGMALPMKYIGYSLDQTLAQTYTFTVQTEAEEILLEDLAFPHKPGLVQVRHGEGLKVEQTRPINLAHAERVSLSIKRMKP